MPDHAIGRWTRLLRHGFLLDYPRTTAQVDYLDEPSDDNEAFIRHRPSGRAAAVVQAYLAGRLLQLGDHCLFNGVGRRTVGLE